MKTKECQQCGREFETFKKHRKFCGKICFGLSRKKIGTWNKGTAKIEEVICKSCGKKFKAKLFRKRKTCSLRCRNEVLRKSNKGRKFTEEHIANLKKSHTGKFGKLSSNWQGGIDYENKKLRHSLEYEIWRNEVYKRDNWTCRLCRSKKDIVAHHLKLFSEFPELRFSVDNGITLCRSCHMKLHFNNKKQNNGQV